MVQQNTDHDSNNRTNRFLTSSGRSRIAIRLVITTVVFSFFITLVTTLYQLYRDYRRDVQQIDGYFELIGSSYLKSLSRSVWMYDGKQIEAQLDGLIKLPDMECIEIEAGGGYAWSAGSRRSRHMISREFPLTFVYRDETYHIGSLRAIASLDNIYSRLIDKTLTILVTNGIRAFLVSGFILFIFQMLVTRHLVFLSEQLRKFDVGHEPDPVVLKRKRSGDKPDELDQVVLSINHIFADLHHSNIERTKHLDELEKAHQRFLTVLDSVDAHIYVADMQRHHILFMNEKMKRDFGGDLIGQTCWEVFRNATEPCSHCTNESIVDRTGNPTGVCAWQGQNPVTGKWYMNHDRAIQWVDGRIVRMQIAMDITQLKEMEEELRQSHKMEAVGILAGGIAHDFNNILSVIIGNAELAMEDVPEWNPGRAFLAEIKTAGLRAKEIVRQLLSYSRKNFQKHEPIQIIPLVEEAVKFLRSIIPTTIDIQLHVGATDETVLADAAQLHQVMMNLCVNAAQAMEPEGGAIHIRLEPVHLDAAAAQGNPDVTKGAYVSIVVRDTGPGIDGRIIDQIFDPYFTTKEVGKGSGMGLAVVQGVVKSCNGSITVTSDPGRGTTFTVLLPITKGSGPAESVQEETLPGGSERILLVDDEEPVVRMVQLLLERLGYWVESKTSPLEALDLFALKPEWFDLVITDMTMPQMTGIQLSEKLMEIRSDVPIIICTGHSPHLDEKKAKESGIAAYAVKPIVKKDIAILIRKVLDAASE